MDSKYARDPSNQFPRCGGEISVFVRGLRMELDGRSSSAQDLDLRSPVSFGQRLFRQPRVELVLFLLVEDHRITVVDGVNRTTSSPSNYRAAFSL